MVDSFRLAGEGTTQVQSSDGTREDDNDEGNCDPSYPDVCIKSPPPNLNCPDIPYKNFKVIGNDPHGFDGDNDGIGCDSTNGGGVPPPGKCDRVSYPDRNICIPPYPPDLNCPDISYKNFRVTGSDPHGFDRDKDGIGCESTEGGGVTPPPGPEPSVCYFDPMDKECDPIDGHCPEGFGMNEQDRCVPTDDCPEGYGRADEDETGTCYKDEELKKCEDGSIRLPDDYCPPPVTPEPEPPTKPPLCRPCNAGPGEDCPDVCLPPTPITTPTPEPTPATPTPPVDPGVLARSQPQCEFGVDPEAGTCNTEDILSEPLQPTPEPTTTPDEEVEEEPEEETEDEPEEETEDEPEDNGESNEVSSSE